MKPAFDVIDLHDASIGSIIEPHVVADPHPPASGAVADRHVRKAQLAAERSRVAAFIEVTKPRMNVMVVTTTLFGFIVAARGSIHWPTLLFTVVGTFLSASSASVLNQLVERRHDARMPRTRYRPLPLAQISAAEAIVFGVGMGVGGVVLLWTLVNPLTGALSLITILWYLLLYTPSKRLTTLNTVIGAVPGAIPPMMGFAAATGRLSPTAVALFGILFVWQIPHFLAIAIMYRDDYSIGGFKMLPCDDENLAITRRQIVLYSVALIPTSLMPTLLGATGTAYAIVAVILGLMFLAFGLQCASSEDAGADPLISDNGRLSDGGFNRSKARRLFFASIIYLPLLLAALALDRL